LFAQRTRIPTSARSIGFCAIWVCISSSSSFCLCAICPSFYTSFVMGVVSAQREVLRFAGMGTVQ
jgi:DTW domain-containing protein YfiP